MLVGIVSASRQDPAGGSLTYILSARLASFVAGQALFKADPAGQSSDKEYDLSPLGLRVAISVPAGWETRPLLNYFDARAPGTNATGVDSRYRILGVFAPVEFDRERPPDMLKRILQASGGRFKELAGAKVTPPEGFEAAMVVQTTARYEVEPRDAATTPLGNWVSESGLVTVFAAVATPDGILIAYAEVPDEGAIGDVSGLFKRIHLRR